VLVNLQKGEITMKIKKVFALSSLIIVTALLLTACNGGFNIQGRIQPNDQGGVDISGGAVPQPTAAPPPAASMDQTTLILIIVGAVVLILILIMLASRRPSAPPPA
jgi:hypothetical protein